ncbi:MULTISPECIES: VIT family protein [unclassified Ligilactobacillus]|uniref:VIT1/CCC1 transporter family protein n=1 Tax=unclassified Ligilactobacillus TaxID=2767920 RepID=UPI003853BCC2
MHKPKKRRTPSLANRINLIRAAVMGANDGILSIAGIVLGVAGAAVSPHNILLSGLSGMLAGTVSMAMGEFVSVSSQRDTEKQAITDETMALDEHYDEEFNFIKNKYVRTGISPALAAQATKEMLAGDRLTVAVRERYGFDPADKTSAVGAAIASMISFPTGSLLPLLAITLFPASIRIGATIIAVALALAITGYAAAVLGNAQRGKALRRNVLFGLLTMIVTYVIGTLFA